MAFSSNSSCLWPVFLNNTELWSTSFTELVSITEFLSTSELTDFWYNTELSSTGGSEETFVRLG